MPKYGGIGALIRKRDNSVIIAEPYEGFPADIAGLKAGDIILKIDGVPVEEKDLKEVSEMLKGNPNSECKITVKNPFNEEARKVTITRKEIKISDVPYYGIIKNNIGYIRLSGFTKGAGDEVKAALIDLKDKGANSLIAH